MQAVYDAKSEEIGPGVYRFKAEIGERRSPLSRPISACAARAVLVAPLALCGQDTEDGEGWQMVAAACQSCSLTPCTRGVCSGRLMCADFCGEKVVERHMSRLGREPLYECITAASKTRDTKAMELVLMEYGEH